MVGAVLKAMLVVCLVSALAGCSEKPPDRPDRGRIDHEPRKAPIPVTAPERTGASGPAERTVIESTMGGLVLRRDEGVLRIDEAELLRSKENDEIFVRATVRGPVEHKDCFLMKGETWLALRDAMESGHASEAPAVPESFWADALGTEKLSSGDTFAVSFQEDPDKKGRVPNPRDTPFFALCYKDESIAGEDPQTTTWYDVAHVDGTPTAP